MSKLKIDPQLFVFLLIVTVFSGVIAWIGDSIYGKAGLIIFSALFFYYSIYRPTYGLYFLAFSIPIESLNIIAFNLSLMKLIGVCIFLGWLIKFWRSSKKQVFFGSEMTVAIVFFLWSLLSYFWAEFSQTDVLKRAITLLLFVGFFCLISQVLTSKKHLEHIIAANLFGSSLLLAIGSLAAISISTGVSLDSSFYGFNLGLFGVHMALPCFFLWMKFLAMNDYKKQIIVGIIISYILIITSILSPVSFGLISLLLIMGALKPLFKKHYKRASIYLACILLVIFISLSISPASHQETVEAMNFDETRLMWSEFESQYALSPNLGVGLGNIEPSEDISGGDLELEILAPNQIFQDRRAQTHIYIETLVELGIIGTIILLYLIILVLKKGTFMIRHLKANSSSWLVAATLLSYFTFIVTIDLFSPMIQRKMFWFALGLIVVSSRVYMRELRQGLHH